MYNLFIVLGFSLVRKLLREGEVTCFYIYARGLTGAGVWCARADAESQLCCVLVTGFYYRLQLAQPYGIRP